MHYFLLRGLFARANNEMFAVEPGSVMLKSENWIDTIHFYVQNAFSIYLNDKILPCNIILYLIIFLTF